MSWNPQHPWGGPGEDPWRGGWGWVEWRGPRPPWWEQENSSRWNQRRTSPPWVTALPGHKPRQHSRPLNLTSPCEVQGSDHRRERWISEGPFGRTVSLGYSVLIEAYYCMFYFVWLMCQCNWIPFLRKCFKKAKCTVTSYMKGHTY